MDIKAAEGILTNFLSVMHPATSAFLEIVPTLFRFFWFAYALVLSFLMPRNRRTRSPTLSIPISFKTSLSISRRFSPLMWFFRNSFSYSPHLTLRRYSQTFSSSQFLTESGPSTSEKSDSVGLA